MLIYWAVPSGKMWAEVWELKCPSPSGKCLLQVHQLMRHKYCTQDGWGDLTAVDFHQDAELLHSWPPPNFDVKVISVPFLLFRLLGRGLETLFVVIADTSC